jgi:hypothetical protein
MNKLQDEKPKTWLQKLKEESWEAELVISTIAIFGTLQLFKVVDWGTFALIDQLHPDQYMAAYGILFCCLLGISILVTMFVIHFLLRTYWVGLVGLNSVFPDYSVEDSVYSEIYTKKLISILPKVEHTIEDIDDLSSVIFSAAFFMLGIYLYLPLIAFLYLLLYNYLSAYVPPNLLLIPFYLLTAFVLFQTVFSFIANLKMYKQNERVQTWYFEIVKYGSILMLGPLYKYLLQITMLFTSNFKKKTGLIGLIILFITVGFTVTIFQFLNSKMPYLVNQEYFYDETKVYNGYYASKAEAETFLLAPQIDSDIIESKMMQLFIPVYDYETKMHKGLCGSFEADEESTREERRKAKKAWFLNCYTKYNQVFLNEKGVATEFMKYELPETGQFGILTYIDLELAKKGKNELKIIKYLDGEEREWKIPFQYVLK